MLRWITVAVLAALSALSTTVALSLEQDVTPEPTPDRAAPAAVTPVLSARRVPDITAAPLAVRRLAADLQHWVDAHEAETCLQVRDDDEVLFEHRAEEAMVPASAQKLLTAAGAVLAKDPAATFQTRVVGQAPVDGVVEGDLHLVGGGDPLLATRDYVEHFPRQPQVFTDLEALADAVVGLGVREVTGSVLGDESRYDTQRYLPEVWPSRFIANDQTGPLSALTVNDGFSEYPGDAAGSVTVDPHPDPPTHAAEIFTFLLGSKGVAVGGTAGAGVAPDGLEPLAVLESEPFGVVVSQMLRESDNGTAELLLKEIGRATNADPTSAGGSAGLVELLTEAGFETDALTVADGSGLSSLNRADCDLLADVLTDPRTGEIVTDGLAVAGENGTLERRFTESPVRGSLRAKTGSLNQVTALVGTVPSGSGEQLVFAYLANLDPSRRVDAALVGAQDELVAILHAHPRHADPAAVAPMPVEPAG